MCNDNLLACQNNDFIYVIIRVLLYKVFRRKEDFRSIHIKNKSERRCELPLVAAAAGGKVRK